jgi:DNA mismatch repair protein MutS
LRDHFAVGALDGFGIGGQPLAIRAAGALLQYLAATQLDGLAQITELHGYSTDAYMPLDAATRRNLELTEGSRGGRGGSLLATIDRTRTPMGGRLLRRWLGQPLVELAPLIERQEAVALCARDALLRARITPLLGGVGDLERLINRAVTGAATPRDLATLARSLGRLPDLLAAIADVPSEDGAGGPLAPWLPPLRAARLDDLVATIGAAIADDPPAALGPEVPSIRTGFAPDLDELREKAREAKAYIAGLERTERERTGIRSLKVGYNKVFGYYLEISHTNRDAIPDDYIRKQTLVGAERYITPELKEYETLVSGAEERIAALEGTIYREVVGQGRGRGAVCHACGGGAGPPGCLRRAGDGRGRAPLRPPDAQRRPGADRLHRGRAAPDGGGIAGGRQRGLRAERHQSRHRRAPGRDHHRPQYGRQEHLSPASRVDRPAGADRRVRPRRPRRDRPGRSDLHPDRRAG